MLKKTMLVAASLAIVAAGCGGDSASEPTATLGAGESTTTLAATSTTGTAAESTTTEATTTTEAVTTTTGATSGDGLPETFLAIDNDYAAVEVDTATGEVLQTYGQIADAAALAEAEEIAPNVLVGIWRVRDGSMVGLSDCCEPAAGNIFYLAADSSLGDDPYSQVSGYGWTLSPAPTQNLFANLGYSMVIEDPSVTVDTGPGLAIDGPDLGFPQGSAAWSRDGSQVYWTSTIGDAVGLATLDLAEGDPALVTTLGWVAEEQLLSGIGSQASGNLVGFLHTFDSAFEIVETEGVVFTVEGDLVASFPVETGSVWGGYEPSGTRLIYVDDDGHVRWQGGGGMGVLGEGYLFASW